MNNKKIFTVAMLLLICFHLVAQQRSFTLTGKLSTVTTGSKIYLLYYNPNVKKDSAIVQNGEFQFKGDLPSPVQAQLYLPHGLKKVKMPIPLRGDLDFFNLYLDEGEIRLNGTDSVKHSVVTNSQINDEDKKLGQTLLMLQKKITLLADQFKLAPVAQQKDSAFLKLSNDKIIKVYKEMEAAKIQFAKKNPDSYVSLNAVFELARGRSMDYHQVDTTFNALSDRYKATFLAIQTKKLISTGLSTSIGSRALDFAEPDADGKIFKLSDFKGKYVMLEFWASWCGPCRKESPNLVRAYDKYKDKNFTIVSISLDTKREAWLKAVEDDKIPYLQLGDLKGPQVSEVAKSYGIQSIPESYLIDPSGKIIGKNLRGEALNKKLTSLFN